MPSLSHKENSHTTSSPISTTKLVFAWLLVFGMAAFFRLWDLSQFPPDVEGDGSGILRSAFDFVAGNSMVSHKFWVAGEPLIITLRWALYKLTGDMSRGMIFMMSAIAGITAVMLTFAFARRRFNFRVAVLAGTMFALSMWHIVYSRYAFSEIAFQPLCLMLVVGVIYRYYLTQSPRYLYALAALFSVYCFVGYHTILTIPPLFALYMLWTKSARPLFSRAALIALGVFLLLGTVQCFFYKHLFHLDSASFFPKTNYEYWVVMRQGTGFLHKGFATFVHNLGVNSQEIARLFYNGEIGRYDDQMFTVSERSASALQVWFLGLFAGGLMYMIVKRDNPLYKLLLCWFAVEAFMYFICNRPTKRYWLCFAPAFFITAGVFVDFLLRSVEMRLTSPGARAFFQRSAIAAGVALTVVGFSVVYREYFIDLQQRNFNLYEIYNAEKIYNYLKASEDPSSFVIGSHFDQLHDHLWFYSKHDRFFEIHSTKEYFNAPGADPKQIFADIYAKNFKRVVLILSSDEAATFEKKFNYALPEKTASILSTNGIPSHFIYRILPAK